MRSVRVRESVEEQDLAWVKLLEKAIKDRKQDPAEKFVLDLKVDRCQFNKDYLNLVLLLDH